MSDSISQLTGMISYFPLFASSTAVSNSGKNFIKRLRSSVRTTKKSLTDIIDLSRTNILYPWYHLDSQKTAHLAGY